MATTLKNAAKTIACCGFSTPVETTVAIEFAASWKPFMKSNRTARTTSRATTPNEISAAVTRAPRPTRTSLGRPARRAPARQRPGARRSRVLQDDALDQVGDVLAAVRDRLE